MRVPMLRDTFGPYLTRRAALPLAERGSFSAGLKGKPVAAHVESVTLPGMGTGAGRVPPDVCAHQVRTVDVLLGRAKFPTPFTGAQAQHQRLYPDDFRDLHLGETPGPMSANK